MPETLPTDETELKELELTSKDGEYPIKVGEILAGTLEGESGGGNIPTLPAGEGTKPYLPGSDFSQVVGTNLDTGLVIEDDIGNQYVWIEVPKTEAVYPTAGLVITSFTNEEYTKIENDLHDFTNTYRNGTSATDTYYTDSTTGWFKDEMDYNTAKQKMLKSVYQNGGFWIGRYEAGIEINRKEEGEATIVPQSKANLYPYTYVTRTQAKVLAEQVLGSSGTYTSSLMFGVQWDLVLKYLETKAVEKAEEANKVSALTAIQLELKSDSSIWGNYSNNTYNITNTNVKYSLDYGVSWTNAPYDKTENKIVLLTTGADSIFSKQNIYDLAGNVYEWTNEYTSDTVSPCSGRGCCYTNNGSNSPASYRGNDDTSSSDNALGFRVSLY